MQLRGELAFVPPCISCGRKLQVIEVRHQDETGQPD